MDATQKTDRGFTLVELLVVIAIVALLAAILFPVFALAREKARQTACLSNERQLALAFFQYAQDNDETMPNGISQDRSGRYWPGEGWAGQCAAYVKAPDLLRCPSDPTASRSATDRTISYGYNINIAGPFTEPPAAGATLASLPAPTRTVLLFEVSGVTANPGDAREGTEPGGTEGSSFSASGNGLDNRLYAQDLLTSIDNQYATGYLGGRPPSDPQRTQFQQAAGRHAGGSNVVLADGHARWLPGDNVSSGVNASAPGCGQDDVPPVAGCDLGPATLAAAGTDATTHFRATFSVH